MTKSPDAFRTISEVADWLGIQAHVLRFWESKFSQVKPVKRAGGRRYYRPTDMLLLGGIKQLLYEDGLTIKGVQKILREQGVNHVAAMSAPLAEGPEEPAVDDSPESPILEDKAPEPPSEIAEPPAAEIEVAEEVSPPEALKLEVVSEDGGEEEQLPLPSFTHHAAQAPEVEAPAPLESPAQPADVAAASDLDDTPAEPARPAALVVDAPDPPQEDEIPYNPGVMAELVTFNRLGAEKVAAAKPLIRALDEWLDKVSGAA
ncbi:MerR family transcriptional regulator [Sedimentitalea sp.]|uniref:MerR family transcriptional regulator n=1 Tax=Sedimentitalea sp. TaxID=2048915 RepID=UPI00329731D6